MKKSEIKLKSENVYPCVNVNDTFSIILNQISENGHIGHGC